MLMTLEIPNHAFSKAQQQRSKTPVYMNAAQPCRDLRLLNPATTARTTVQPNGHELDAASCIDATLNAQILDLCGLSSSPRAAPEPRAPSARLLVPGGGPRKGMAQDWLSQLP